MKLLLLADDAADHHHADRHDHNPGGGGDDDIIGHNDHGPGSLPLPRRQYVKQGSHHNLWLPSRVSLGYTADMTTDSGLRIRIERFMRGYIAIDGSSVKPRLTTPEPAK